MPTYRQSPSLKEDPHYWFCCVNYDKCFKIERGRRIVAINKRLLCHDTFCTFNIKSNEFNKMKRNPAKWASMNLQSDTKINRSIAKDIINDSIEFI